MKSASQETNPFDLSAEFSRTISDLADGVEPTTVTGALLHARRKTLSTEGVMAVTGQDEFQVDRTVAALQVAGFVLTEPSNGSDNHFLRGLPDAE